MQFTPRPIHPPKIRDSWLHSSSFTMRELRGRFVSKLLPLRSRSPILQLFEFTFLSRAPRT